MGLPHLFIPVGLWAATRGAGYSPGNGFHDVGYNLLVRTPGLGGAKNAGWIIASEKSTEPGIFALDCGLFNPWSPRWTVTVSHRHTRSWWRASFALGAPRATVISCEIRRGAEGGICWFPGWFS
jgi:hypothetical protein